MKIVALLPVNALSRVKTRLAPTLTPQERERLVVWMAGRALRALAESGIIAEIALVTPDARLARWAASRTIFAIEQTSDGLNAGLEEGRRWAERQGADGTLVMLPDVPLVTGADIRMLVDACCGQGEVSSVVLAPDRHQVGTNALLVYPGMAMPFAFGERSLEHHQALAHERGACVTVMRNAHLAFDVDTVRDVEQLSGLGLWTPSAVDRWANAREGSHP